MTRRHRRVDRGRNRRVDGRERTLDQDLEDADLDPVVQANPRLLDIGLVDLHAIGALQVVDEPGPSLPAHGGMATGDRIVGQHHFVVTATPEADLGARQRHDLRFAVNDESKLELLGQ